MPAALEADRRVSAQCPWGVPPGRRGAVAAHGVEMDLCGHGCSGLGTACRNCISLEVAAAASVHADASAVQGGAGASLPSELPKDTDAGSEPWGSVGSPDPGLHPEAALCPHSGGRTQLKSLNFCHWFKKFKSGPEFVFLTYTLFLT